MYGRSSITLACLQCTSVLVLALAGCGTDDGEDCSLIGCGIRNVVVEFSPALDQAAEYRFDIRAGDTSLLCVIDFDPSVAVDELGDDCEGLDVRGDADRGAQAIHAFQLFEARNVSIKIARDGQPVLDHSFSPEFRSMEVNGPGCGECRVAVEAVTVE